ncbi:hypothetical protein GobsT_30940 [Gemmata obscuriglobus]|nr:hypothetical protein GobsT_30940 [Gemmata obscuriglobus]VTS06171.1 unnamed protein product [Gemmata obscuriglobus UQM 2246]
MTTAAKTSDIIGELPCSDTRCAKGWITTRTRVAEMERGEYNLSKWRCSKCDGKGIRVVARPPQIACGDLPDPSGLLAWISADPDEDTHRLGYADWLDEHEQHQRAEYIRLCCAPAGSLPHTTRVGELFDDLFQRLPPSYCLKDMHRGFIKRIVCPWERWRDHGDDLRSREWVPLVELTTQVVFDEAVEEFWDTHVRVAGRDMATIISPHDGSRMDAQILERRWLGTRFILGPIPF